jgi:hypothetical protein
VVTVQLADVSTFVVDVGCWSVRELQREGSESCRSV